MPEAVLPAIGTRLTLPMAKARGFYSSTTRAPIGGLTASPCAFPSCEGGSRVPHGTYLRPGHLTTCQVDQVQGLVLAPRSTLRHGCGCSFTAGLPPPTSQEQVAKEPTPTVPKASGFATIVHHYHHLSNNTAGTPYIPMAKARGFTAKFGNECEQAVISSSGDAHNVSCLRWAVAMEHLFVNP